jgi:Flp pilus assembly protein TadD
MAFRSKAHWTAVLAIGLPLVISGCAQTGSSDYAGSKPSAAPNVNSMTLAQKLRDDGNHANAAIMYQQAVTADPSNAEAWIGLGDSQLKTGAFPQAEGAFMRALQLQPNNTRALHGLAKARILKGEPQFATAQLEKVIQIDPSDIKAINTLAVTQDALGQHKAAQGNYRKVLKLDPQNQSAKNNLALSLALTGDRKESIKLLEEIGQSASSSEISKRNLALIYAADGRTDEAMQIARASGTPGTIQQVAAIHGADGEAEKSAALKRALGIELRGAQFVAPNQQMAVVSPIDDTQYTEGLVNITTNTPSSTQAQQPPSIITLKTTNGGSSTTVATKSKSAGKIEDEAWADDWNEELVDAADIGEQPVTEPPAQTAGVTETAEPLPVAPTVDAGADTIGPSQGAAAESTTKYKVSPPVATVETAKNETPTDGKPSQMAGATADATQKPATTGQASPAPSNQTSPQLAAASSTITATDKTPSAGVTAAQTPTPKETSPAVDTTKAGATTATSATNGSTTPTDRSIAVAALPTVEKTPATPVVSNVTTGAPKKLTTENGTTDKGTTVTEQKVNAAKIYTVQIASFRKEDEALASWKMLTTEQGDLIASLPHNVEKADLGKEKGIYYRLQAGNFTDAKDAKSLCSSLQKRSIECMVVEVKQANLGAASAASQPTTVQ